MPYALSLCHALFFLSVLPYLYDQTALLLSTELTSAVATILILSSLLLKVLVLLTYCLPSCLGHVSHTRTALLLVLSSILPCMRESVLTL
jgi:hypothetical protein